MKYFYIFTILNLMFLSCQGDLENTSTDHSSNVTKENQSEDQAEDTAQIANTVHKDSFAVDTFYFADKKLIIRPIDDTSCFTIQHNSNPDEEKLIAEDKTVERIGDSLIFTLNNEDTVVMVNTASEKDRWSDFGYNYYYEGDHKDIGYWEVFAIGYECHSTIMINKKSGYKTDCPGGVSVSKEQRYVAIYNADQEANYTTNHISLFEPQADSLKKLCFIDLDLKKWAPYGIRWTSPSTFQLKQGRFEENGYHIVYNCAIGEIVN